VYRRPAIALDHKLAIPELEPDRLPLHPWELQHGSDFA
jgi:hypothetical protein